MESFWLKNSANLLHQDCVGVVWSDFVGSNQTAHQLWSDSGSDVAKSLKCCLVSMGHHLFLNEPTSNQRDERRDKRNTKQGHPLKIIDWSSIFFLRCSPLIQAMKHVQEWTPGKIKIRTLSHCFNLLLTIDMEENAANDMGQLPYVTFTH